MREWPLGATLDEAGRARFKLWAPAAAEVRLRLEGRVPRTLKLTPSGDGDHGALVPEAGVGTRYAFAVDGGPWRPDPASRRQPEGVHGPSELVAPSHPWTDRGWPGVALEALVIYELEVGSFTLEGRFDSALARLDALAELGVSAIELMPLAEVPGGRAARNWGYDGVALFAVRESFGGEAGLHAFVDACHARGLAVIIDVVYNHLGPEGNYLADFGPYFTSRHQTPWGAAPNLDGLGSEGVRRFFLEHALEQLERHHADGLRLDSVVSLFDTSPRPFLAELSEAVDALAARRGRPLHLIAEADDNDPRWIRPRETGGLGLHAMWAEDLHHALHARLTGERAGYYRDFGRGEQVARAFFQGVARPGSADEPAPERLVVYAQNHDQVGNRTDGARLASLVAPAAERVALCLALLSPQLPLLFMGQETGSRQPFYFYTSFGDPGLGRAARRGRAREARAFGWPGTPPDPQDPATLEASRPLADEDPQRARAYQEMHRSALRLRRHLRASGRPRALGRSASPDAFWGAWPSGHVLVAVLEDAPAEPRIGRSGSLVFDSEAHIAGADPVPPRLRADRALVLRGPRVLVYGPPDPDTERQP